MESNFRKFKAEKNNRKFIIEQDLPDIGWYLKVFEDEKCVADHLQDSLNAVIEQAE